MQDQMCKHCYKHVQRVEIKPEQFQESTHYFCRLREQDPEINLELHNIFMVADLESSVVVDNCPVAYKGKWKICPYYKK